MTTDPFEPPTERAGDPAPPPPAAGPTNWGAPVAEPHPSGLAKRVRDWGLAIHLSAFVAVGLGGLSFLGPLVIWLLKREEHPFLDYQGKEALNFHLSLLLYAIISIPLMLILVGFLALLAVVVVGAVFTIVAAVKAANGEPYRLPLTIRFVK